MNRLFITAIIFAAILSFGSICSPYGIALCQAETERNTKVFVVSSQMAAPYEELLEGFKAALTRSGKAIEIQVSSCEEFLKSSKMPTGTGAPGPANIFFTIGARALTLIAQNTPPQVPILAGMVLGSEEISGRQNITGVTMEFPIGAQLEKMRQILPKCRNIGVIYSPANKNRVELAARVAESAGFNLHTRQVNVPSELPEALQYLANRIDVLWGIPDDLVYTQQTAKHILLYSFRNRIPMAGLSASWTKAGALYSLEWDYRDLGIQCADFALKIIDGTPPSSLQPTGPRKILYTLNLKTAQHLKLEIPDKIVQGTSQIFE